MEIRISVRNFVEFLLRSGDIDNRGTGGYEGSMQEGSRIHRMLQKRMGADYTPEVSLRHQIDFGEYSLRIEGRADGILAGSIMTVDEIKGTYRELHKVKEPVQVHLAQAKCYAYIYGLQNKQSLMGVRMTYCNMDTEEVKYFEETYSFDELEKWFLGLVQEYGKWAEEEYRHKECRQKSARELAFPFPYREGQKELVSHVYRTICHGKKLFIQAPTGAGKTISTVFPAVKAVGEGKADRIFYLTAKTITRKVAEEAFSHLEEHGLMYNTVVLTAKEKICFMETTDCNPQSCPYAKGHYDRVNDAIYDFMTHETRYSREAMEQYARKHEVCPFELGLDMSLFADAVICDYNYLFDPYAYLRRFFADGVKGDYLFLVDEAHNLVDRGREMYSAQLIKEDFLKLKKTVRDHDVRMEKQLEKCNKELLQMKREGGDFAVIESCGSLVMSLMRLHTTMNEYLEEHSDSLVRKEILDLYFQISRFLAVNELIDDNYVTYSQTLDDGSFLVKQYCVNPSERIRECLEKGKGSILFSATLLPIQYYKKLLGGKAEDFEVYAKSVFNPDRRKLLIGNEVTSRYKRRGEQEYYNIAFYIHRIVKERKGNYLLFFPSHQFLEQVYRIYREHFLEEEFQECLIQEDFMSEKDRENFLQRFSGIEENDFSEMIAMEVEEEEEKSLLGFCVLGGIFGEGIDLKEERLIGAIIVGTGFPQVCRERELLKAYFDREGNNGFDYAYRYPGMNKVLQAAGRVIRTREDIGLVALLDDRFLSPEYLAMFPREWETYSVVSMQDCGEVAGEFWKQYYPQ